MCTRNDEDGLWYSKPYTLEASNGENSLVATANGNPTFALALLSFPGGNALGKKTLLSLVMVSFDIPYMIDGISSSSYHGMGVVVDAEQVPAKVVFVHPVHNFSIVQYDPKTLGAVAGHIGSVELAEKPLEVGETADYIGLSSNWTVVTMNPQRYTAGNIEVLHFDRITKSVGGVFIDDVGAVNALWLSFSYQDNAGRKEVFRGLPVSIVRPIVDELRASRIPESVNILPAQLLTFSLSKARSGLGLSDAWIQKLESCYEDKRQVLGIKRCAAGTDCAEKLESGDLLLAIDGQVVVRDADVERAVDGKTEVTTLVVRDQKEMEVSVRTSQLSAMGTDRVIVWCGLVIQSPHYAVASLGYIPEEGGGVYCSRWCYGSPAHKYGLRATIWLVEVNGEPTRTLDDFLRVVERLGNRESVRLKTISINTKPKVFTLKTDYHYWPTVELRREGWDWKYVEHPVAA
ncbi:hypothetical protein F444_08394 [Phytophthora nicotianae P1976]|uniref:PDZ-like domain-containing protein n=1 Tax=Phytophthora nicotianae P1976 TaxID=1317066 RepID=A0A081ABB7_PHYNI|nr:hypothetical protein F444_08394 [Phytophthora nicotianae P1976]